MLVDLVKTTTADGMRLDAALHGPPKEIRTSGLIDAVVCLHGMGGSFYGGGLFESITPPLLDAGIAVLRANTRGHDGSLMEVPFRLPTVLTASGYVDQYGPQEKYNLLKFADRVPCPVMFTFGQLELEQIGVAFVRVPTALAALPPAGGPFTMVSIPGADHSYAGTCDRLSAEILQWLHPRLQVKDL